MDRVATRSTRKEVDDDLVRRMAGATSQSRRTVHWYSHDYICIRCGMRNFPNVTSLRSILPSSCPIRKRRRTCGIAGSSIGHHGVTREHYTHITSELAICLCSCVLTGYQTDGRMSECIFFRRPLTIRFLHAIVASSTPGSGEHQ